LLDLSVIFISDRIMEFALGLPQYCDPANDFLKTISSVFGVCIPTTLALTSTILGILSILSWLFAQVPQILKNFRLRSTSGLSLLFLLEWLFGDVSNLLGSIFTHQATWQVFLASYYCCVDCVLVGQWLWYEHLRHGRSVRRLRWWKSDDGDDEGPVRSRRRRRKQIRQQKSPGSPPLIQGVPVGSGSKPIDAKSKKHSFLDETTSTPSASSSLRQGGSPFRIPHFSFPAAQQQSSTPPSQPRPIIRHPAPASPMPSPRTLLAISLLLAVAARAADPSPKGALTMLDDDALPWKEWAGRAFSWLSTLLYLGSRVPQLAHNAKRRSTAGLSASLFAAAFCGNLFYASSLLANPCLWRDHAPPDYEAGVGAGGGGWAGEVGCLRREWTARAAPFWLGAAGVLALDAAVGVQFIMFRVREAEEDAPGGRTTDVLVVAREGVRGPGRWRRVSGWMRGWMPVPKRRAGGWGDETETETETETDTETESLLSAPGDDAGSVRGYGAVR
jgi:uncharacterized protein with PQ loop repeat